MLITVIQDEVHVYRYNKDKTLCWLSKKVHLHTTEEALSFITCVGNLTFDAPVHARLSKFYCALFCHFSAKCKPCLAMTTDCQNTLNFMIIRGIHNTYRLKHYQIH